MNWEEVRAQAEVRHYIIQYIPFKNAHAYMIDWIYSDLVRIGFASGVTRGTKNL